MSKIKSFYLSRFLGVTVRTEDDDTVGKIHDLVATVDNPSRVVAVVLQTRGEGKRLLDITPFRIVKIKNRYLITCDLVTEVDPPADCLFLRRQILDKQIVDIDGKKVVRVNDVRLASISSGIFVVAVDVGVEGLLRRLGVSRVVKQPLQWFGHSVSSRYILWENMEPLVPPLSHLKLTMASSRLNTLHPSELADIIEDLDVKTRTALFEALDHERAADVLGELETEAQYSILDQLTVEKAADLLEKLPPDEVADILDDLNEDKAEALLQEMEQETSAEVRELMEYPDDTVGSLMTTDFISFRKNMTVEETIIELRRLKPKSDMIYYLYVVDEEERLEAVLALRDLIVSEPGTLLSDIMNKKIIFVYDMDPLHSLVEIISKYSLLAIPVVDQDRTMLGTVIIDDVVYELLKPKKRPNFLR